MQKTTLTPATPEGSPLISADAIAGTRYADSHEQREMCPGNRGCVDHISLLNPPPGGGPAQIDILPDFAGYCTWAERSCGIGGRG